MATAAASEADDDEWELVNDDGFVYKRKKRPRLEPSTDAASASSALALSDLAAEEKNRRERKKRALLKLKEKYRLEILQWEQLSNTLNDMQQKSPILQQQHKSGESNDASTSSPVQPGLLSGSVGRQLVHELLSQAEIQEAILEDLSNLCDIAETLCSAREEEFKKTFTELPIWSSSPHELVTSLCLD